MSTKTPPETITVDGVTYDVAELQAAVARARETVARGAQRISDTLQRGVSAYRRDVAARADAAACAAAQRDAREHGMQLDPDEAMVWAADLDAVAMAGPDESRVLVRASMLLSYGLSAAAVANALDRWGNRYPELIGTAPDVSWSDAIEQTRTRACRWAWPGGYRCIRAEGHDGAHDAGPF